MATSPMEREDSLLEAHRTSLLEIIEDKNRTLSKKNLVHRLVYIGKLRQNVENRTDVGNYYERLIKNLQNNFQTEPMTGLLLVYLNHLVHVVEASSDMITEIMKDIEDSQKKENEFLEGAKILVISHDITTRLYQNWNFRTLDIQAARMEAYESSEGADKIIIDLLTQLLKLGNRLAITPKVAFKTTLDSLHEKFPELLPQQGVYCRYEYNVGGLVASTIMGVFMLALIIIMLFVIVMWRDWYERRQLIQGRRKRPRQHWGYFSAKLKSPSILLSTPRSDKKPYVVGQHLIRDSRNTTLTRADDWLTKLPPSTGEYNQYQNRYEEKVQTMNFEPEEEAVIVADILPENNRRSAQRTKHDYENAPRKVNYQDGGDENTVYIPYGGAPKSNPDSRQQLRHTVGAPSYHVKMGQVGESQRTTEDLYVAPPNDSTTPRDQTSSRNIGYTTQTDETPGPSGAGRESSRMMVNDDTDKPAVMEFQDSDEEAGMIPVTQPRVEGDVLF